MVAFLLAVALFQQMHQTITVFLSQMQYEKLGASISFMGAAYIVMTLVGLLGIFSSRFTGWFGRRKVILACCAGAFAACIGLGQSNHLFFSALFVFCLRAVFSIMEPLQMQLQNEQISSEYRAAILSVQTIVMDAAGADMSLLLGAVAQCTLSGAFWMGAAFCAGAFGLFELWRHWSKV